ncbi:MAG: hypothetical protein QW579_02820, partial [Desulfurococcaceae archaeon]
VLSDALIRRGYVNARLIIPFTGIMLGTGTMLLLLSYPYPYGVISVETLIPVVVKAISNGIVDFLIKITNSSRPSSSSFSSLDTGLS